MLKTIRKFFAFCSPENRKLFHISLVYSIFLAFFEALRIPAIALVLHGLIGGGITYRDMLTGFGIMAFSVAGAVICNRQTTVLETMAGYRSCAEKRIEIAEHMRYLPMGYFNENSLGSITSVTTNTLSTLENVATRVILLVSSGLFTTILIILALAFFDLRIAAILFVGFLLFLLVNSRMQKASRQISAKKMQADTRLVEQVMEYIQGISEIHAFQLFGDEDSALERAIRENQEVNIAMEYRYTPYLFLSSLILRLTGVAMVFCSIAFYLASSMDLVTCIVMTIASFLVLSSLERAGSYSALIRIVDISVDRVDEVLALKPMDIDGEDRSCDHVDLAARQIHFSYGQRQVIDAVSLSIPEHTKTAIVGPSGGGKTTLAELLARFWDVTAGTVTLDGRDVRSYSMDSLMRNYSFVFQNVYLFHDTIANNIRFGEPDAPMEKVVAVAKKACCHDFITALPDGYDTLVGEGGANLSGGEKQRISIARAMMKDAPIVILDEATANVDPENEALLVAAINALTKEKTIIMIAHRLKTVRDANQILVVDQGKIVQEGTHESLMKEDGIYRRFIEDRQKAVNWRL